MTDTAADTDRAPDLVAMTTDIVSAYLSANRVEASQVARLIASVHAALAQAGAVPEPETVEPVRTLTRAEIRKSITDQGLVSQIDGKTYKTLRRHLTRNGLTPAEYRDRFGLGDDYPMTAPAYSAMRSAMAKAIGLGAKPRGPRGGAAKPKAASNSTAKAKAR